MASNDRWNPEESVKGRYIAALTDNLPALRGKLGISQGDLAHCVGISRQTYCAVEGHQRKMSWDTFLALCFFFDTNHSTHEMLRNVGAYPRELIERFNEGHREFRGNRAIMTESVISKLVGHLDEQALHAVRTVLLLEYARCTKLTGEEVLKAYDGKSIHLCNLQKEK